MNELLCCICGSKIEGYGNNPYPCVTDEDARCCDNCNSLFVIPRRIMELEEHDK